MSEACHPIAIYGAVAQVLTELAEDVEDLGSGLCANPLITAEHMVELQGIDLFAQTLRQLSDVLAANDPAVGAAQIKMEKLRDRILSSQVREGVEV